MRKIVFLKSLAPEHLIKVQSLVPDWEIIAGKDKESWVPHLQDAEIIGGWNRVAESECLEALSSKLRWVHNWGAGVNHLPLERFRTRGIVLTNSSGVHAYPISETILGMMLAFTRRLDLYIKNQMEKEWISTNPSLEMHGKTVGILGVGAIGLETARLCKAFGMRVLGLRRSGNRTEYVDQMYDFHGLQSLLEESDYVINTLPQTKETHHILDHAQFQCMKPTAFYINIGRGDTNNEDALFTALRDKKIAGAALDVFEQEPLPADSPLWNLENSIITPHTAGATEQYDARVMEIFLPNLKAYLEGKQPAINLVDYDLQY